MITEELFITLIFIDMAFTLFFFIALKEYWANLICAGACYLISTGISDMMTSGVDSNGTTMTDPWLASIFGWHALLMLALCGAALLKNTVLTPQRRTRRP